MTFTINNATQDANTMNAMCTMHFSFLTKSIISIEMWFSWFFFSSVSVFVFNCFDLCIAYLALWSNLPSIECGWKIRIQFYVFFFLVVSILSSSNAEHDEAANFWFDRCEIIKSIIHSTHWLFVYVPRGMQTFQIWYNKCYRNMMISGGIILEPFCVISDFGFDHFWVLGAKHSFYHYFWMLTQNW